MSIFFMIYLLIISHLHLITVNLCVLVFMLYKNKNFERYFLRQIADIDESTLLIPDLNDKNAPDLENLKFKIKKGDIEEFCRNNSISPNVLFLAGLNLALNKFNFTDKTLIFYRDCVPLAFIFENRNISIKDYLTKIDEIYRESLMYAESSFEGIIREYDIKPEFFYSFNGNRDLDALPFKCSFYSNVFENNDEFSLVLSYNNRLYSRSFVNLFFESIMKILSQFMENDVNELRLSDIALENEKENIEFSPVELPFIHKRFENQVEQNPERIALVASDATLTYEMLNEKANRIANGLVRRGVTPKSNVLVMLPRTSDLIAAIMGILKAGCAFIPIDLEYPKERINYIYENSQADYIVSNETAGNSIDVKELLLEENNANHDVEISSDDLAYMIYTSGSTGNPKGVMISHENIANQVQNPKSQYDSVLCIATISFDVALDDILTSLSNGLKLILASDAQIKNLPELINLIDNEKPEVAEFTASRLASYLEFDDFCKVISCLKCMFLGGEQFSAGVFETFKKHSDAIVYNSYGPTETTITSNNKEITDVNDITVGLPLDNYVTDVRDLDGKLLPQGVMGELYIGGTGVGKGYYNMEDKTKEVFLKINDVPYYRSGDYAIEHPNGEIEIKGRIDNQIKLRGLRIEIGEIEANLAKYPSIKQCAVAIKNINNNDHLCAYYVCDDEVDKDLLKEFLNDRLTKYMVPTAYVQLDEMPQTPNGKLDLKALPLPKLELEYVGPENEIEESLFEIASDLVDTDKFGVTDDLYAIGFTSLLLMKFNAIIYGKFNINLDIVELLANPTIRNVAGQMAKGNKSDSALAKLIESSKDRIYYPLSPNQLGVYYECVQNPYEAQYNLPAIVRFDKSVNADRLRKAIIKTINAYPYLKTRITLHDGELMHRRDDSIAIDEIPIIETDDISDREIEKSDIKIFKLRDSQLFRAKIYKTLRETVLFFDIHHIISDGESLDNLFNNIACAYEGRELEEEIVDGYLNALIEKENENSEEYVISRDYFHGLLTNGIDSTVLTPNLNGNPEVGKLKSVSKNINPHLIREFCADNRITPNVLFMAGVILGLNKYTFSDKTLITTIFNGRPNSNQFNTQGFLVKTFPIVAVNDDRDITVRQLLNQVDEIWKNTIKHHHYPYIQLSDEFQLKPEFMYTYNNLDGEQIEIDNRRYRVYYPDTLETNYKITFDINETHDNIELQILYNDQLYSEKYAKTFLNSVLNTVNQFLKANIEQLRINEIELNKYRELPKLDPVELPFIHKRFERQFRKNPDEVALVAGDATLTYAELNEKSNRIANGLIAKGVVAKSNVLVMLPRTSDLIASIIGILKAGCAFIPIDLEYPKERIRYIYENSQADYIISDGDGENSLNINELLENGDISNPDVEITPDDLAYMIYTSGSTGNPKGVMISHENACNQVEGNPKCGYDNLLSIATIAFDTSLEDILTGLTNGIKIIFANDSEIKNIVDLIKLIKENKPEVMEFTPSRLLSYLEVEEFCNVIGCAKCIVMGGEQFSVKAFEGIKRCADAVVYNSYGPTEATIASNYKEITDSENITIGKALKNYITEVRDIDGKLLPKGVIGELYIGGVGVGKGYYNMEDKTREVFTTINDIPYYRSGDYAIELPNGEIDVKGRIDNQIKLRGLRIEIGEIESNISRFPAVKQNIVVIREINGSEHLCAYFTGDGKIDIKLLKRYLQSKLTKYMVPTVFMQIDEMPQTPNGKTDLKQLPQPTLDLNYVKPETETEKLLFDLVASLADVGEFGITDDLYALGFTSLTLMKLNSLIYNETGVNIDIVDLFNNPTVQNLAHNIDNNVDMQIDFEEIIKSCEGRKYFPLTSNQMGIYYECMQTDEIKYNIPSLIRFDKSINPEKLRDAILLTIEAHPYLKTRIVTTSEGELRQKRCDDIKINDIEIERVDSISDEEIADRDIEFIPLENSQLFKFKIYETPSETVLFCDFHHIITDGVSQDLLFKDIANAYEGNELIPETIDGFVYSLIEHELADNEVSKDYYQNKFSQGFESTVLTPNLNGNLEDGCMKLVKTSVDSTFVKSFCKDHSISPNVLFMAATVLGLNKFTFSDKALITTIFNGRSSSFYFNTQGMLVKTLPILVDGKDRNMLVEDFIDVVDRVWKESLTHSNYSYAAISQEYHLKPEFFYAYHGSFEVDNLKVDGNYYEMKPLDMSAGTDYKINMDIYDEGETINFYIEYNDAIYTESYVQEFLDSIKYIFVQFFVNDLDKLRIGDIELVPDSPIPEFDEVPNPFIHRRFERQVWENGDRTALVACDATLTYEELNRGANRVANALIKRGVRPRSNILIMLPRNSNLIYAILGVLKAGCAFIPLDLKFPQERIEYIYENSQADYIIDMDGIAINSLSIKKLLEEENDENPNVRIAPDDLAYMIYTSGSTGNPKGVMISHENICNQVQNHKAKFDVVLCIATISFDVSLDDILTPLSNGLKLVLASDDEIQNLPDLIKLLEREKPEVCEFTSSRLSSYLEVEEFCNVIGCLKCIYLGGEQFSTKVFERFRKYSDAIVFNSYGPTEATITSNNKEVTDINDVTVGLPAHNYVTDVRDIDGKLLPKGVMGELYIGGVGVGKGYYNMEDKTNEVFLKINDIPYYRSGDYAVELPNGEIDIKGRIDNQIKLRGLRIEIGEIEFNINNYPSIKQCVIVINKIKGSEHLCAYFTATEKVDKGDLKDYLGKRLTQYMIPTAYVQLDEMPQTPNGKVDLKQLPEPKIDFNYVAPQNRLEQMICTLYSSILGVKMVGAEDDFFEIGGTSLIASKLIIELLKKDYSIKYDDIFKNKTPRKLAKLLSGEASSDDLNLDVIQYYDYSKLENLIEENTFGNFINGENRPIGNVLLTGVTGFLGIHILHEYIKNENGTVYCMLRKGRFDTCEERLRDLINYYFDDDFSSLIGSRIILSEGDITDSEDFKKLENCPIDTLINCAAIVKHYTHDDYIFKVNVDGVINGLNFAEANDIAYVQISTTSVIDEFDDDADISGVDFDERTFYWGQDLSNKYLNSKFLAERIVLEKALSGLCVKIVRVGNLMARYDDGVFQRNYDTNAFLNNIKALKNLKAITPQLASEIVELSPIDYVAKAIIALSKTPNESRIFHAVSDKLISTGDIIDVLNSFGFGIEEVTMDEFRKIYEKNLDENIQGIITADLSIDDLDFEDGENLGEIINADYTLDILNLLGFAWPVCDEAYIKRFISYLNDLDYFDK